MSTLRFPDAIVIGAQRCGTTSLYNWLMAQPGVWNSGEPKREINYFSRWSDLQKGPRWYTDKYRGINNLLVIEKSPTYLDHRLVPSRIKDAGFSPKFIVLLRNPIDRAYSHFQKARAKGFETIETFHKACDKSQAKILHEVYTLKTRWTSGYWLSAHHVLAYLRRGLYARHLDNWFQVFPRDRFLILRSEDIFQDPHTAIKQACNFLEIDYWRPLRAIQKLKRYQRLHYDPMPTETRRWLEQCFKRPNQNLAALLGDAKWLWRDQ